MPWHQECGRELVSLCFGLFGAGILIRVQHEVVVEIPMPDEQARLSILQATVAAVIAAFPGTADLARPGVLAEAAAISVGLDARRLRKAVAEACAWRPEAQGDPSRVTGADLLAVLNHARSQ